MALPGYQSDLKFNEGLEYAKITLNRAFYK